MTSSSRWFSFDRVPALILSLRYLGLQLVKKKSFSSNRRWHFWHRKLISSGVAAMWKIVFLSSPLVWGKAPSMKSVSQAPNAGWEESMWNGANLLTTWGWKQYLVNSLASLELLTLSKYEYRSKFNSYIYLTVVFNQFFCLYSHTKRNSKSIGSF